MTSAQWLVVALSCHVCLTFIVGALTLRARIEAVRSGKVRLQALTTNNEGWPESARKLANNFNNQFQVPLLVFVAGSLLVATGLADAFAVGLAFAFVVARLLHTLEHTRRNSVPHRLAYFLASYAFALALWGWFVLRFLEIG